MVPGGKWIYLGQQRFTLVDQGDFEELQRFNWHYHSDGRGSGCVARNRLLADRPGGKWVYLHRDLLGEPASEIDHKNGDTLDNRRQNLRIASRIQNTRNRRRIGQFKGVVFRARSNRYEAKIGVEGRRIWLGQFPSAQEAARAYDDAARQYFGDFACLNFPHPGERPSLA